MPFIICPEGVGWSDACDQRLSWLRKKGIVLLCIRLFLIELNHWFITISKFNFEQILERKIHSWSLWWVGRLWPKSWIINRQLAFIAKRHPTLLGDIHYFLVTYDWFSILPKPLLVDWLSLKFRLRNSWNLPRQTQWKLLCTQDICQTITTAGCVKM